MTTVSQNGSSPAKPVMRAGQARSLRRPLQFKTVGPTGRPTGSGPGVAGARSGKLLGRWIAMQAVNLRRHASSLRPFSYTEFGSGAAAPSHAHIDAANRFIGGLRSRLDATTAFVDGAAAAAVKHPTDSNLAMLLRRKD